MGILLDGFWMLHHDIGVAAKKRCGFIGAYLFRIS